MKAEYGHGLLNAPDDEEGVQFKWLHIRSGDMVKVILSGKLPLWYRAHWYEGRMTPCDGDKCKLCDAGVGRQRRWVFAIATLPDYKVYLWEVSEALAQEIRVIIERHEQQKDVQIRITREGSGPKGRLNIEDRGLDTYHKTDGLVFPEPQEALELTWATVDRLSESRAKRKSSEAETEEREVTAGREY